MSGQLGGEEGGDWADLDLREVSRAQVCPRQGRERRLGHKYRDLVIEEIGCDQSEDKLQDSEVTEEVGQF